MPKSSGRTVASLAPCQITAPPLLLFLLLYLQAGGGDSAYCMLFNIGPEAAGLSTPIGGPLSVNPYGRHYSRGACLDTLLGQQAAL
jgi:hypothetical protein